ncbi:RIP metalloprotease RseP [Terracidiphilus gabretensis]|uniref:RIP metalloprotease RseP n=1 Tax=Terracidiphilus gabretensis TaxID=1577687 RepID=UPI0012FC5935|nr:RIP metalloprotease RseP [Terracidiphilus gabretensis]
MENLHGFVVAVVAFVVLIGVMVTVHEFGHFIMAKLFRVRVESFSLGFGPRLFGFKHGDTDYKVCLLPLGGYVAMTGESMPGENMKLEADSKEEIEAYQRDPGALTSHPRWQRILIGLAGPVSNFILAFVLMGVYYWFFNEEPKDMIKQTVVEWVVPGSPAAQAGIHAGDIIRRFDSYDNPDWGMVGARMAVNSNQTVAATIERDGQSIPLSLHVPENPKGQETDTTFAGMLAASYSGPIGVFKVQTDRPAERAGLRDGDLIESVDGLQFHTVPTLLAYMQAYPGKQVTLSVLRGGSPLTLTAQPSIQQGDTVWTLGFEWARPSMQMKPLPFGEAMVKSASFWKDNSTLILDVLGRLFTRKVGVSQLSGPVGIARMAGQAAEMKGYLPKFGLAAAISLNLGILNLMPFPILDGGMILLLLIEGVMRHDISLVVKERIYQAAFVVLVVFFAFIIFNDVTKLPIFTHLKP